MVRERRRIANLVVALAALGLAFVAQSCLARQNLSDGLILYGVAVVVFVYTLRRLKDDVLRPLPVPSGGKQILPQTLPRIWPLFLLPLPVLLDLVALRYFGRAVHLSRAWSLYLISIISFPAIVRLTENRSSHLVKPPGLAAAATDRRLTVLDWILPALVLAVAAFMRLYHFQSIPFGTWYDEADNGLQALRIIREPHYRPVYTNLPTHFFYVIALSFKLWGVSTLSIRILTVIMGIATSVSAYFLGRELFNRRIGFILGFLLAVSRWSVNFSRIGLHGISTPLFEILALYFLLKGLRSQRACDFACGGLALGLGLCFYNPFILFPLVIALFIIYYILIKPQIVKIHFLNFTVFVLAALLVFAPVGQFALKNPQLFWARTHKVSIFKAVPGPAAWQAMAESAVKHLLMFNYKGDPNGRHNLPGAPMLDFSTSVLFVLGLGYSLYRWRSPRYLLLVIWLVVMLCGGVFSLPFEAPQSLRAIGTLPVVYLLACVPLALIEAESSRVLNLKSAVHFQSARHLVPLMALLAFIGWDNYNVYFNVQANDFASWSAFSTRETIIAQEVTRLGEGYRVYLTPVLTSHLTTRFLAPDFQEQNILDLTDALPLDQSGTQGVALFVDAESQNVRELIERYYPQANKQEFRPPQEGPTLLYLYTLSPEDVEGLQGLSARYYHEGEILDRRDGRLDFEWGHETPLPLPFRAEWKGTLVVPEYGAYTLSVEVPGWAELQLDGAPVLTGSGRAAQEITLARGNHALILRGLINRKGTLRFLWRPPHDDALTVVPQEVLYVSPVTGNGLAGNYYANDQWTAPPAFSQIDPVIAIYFHLIPLPRPYTVEWQGQIEIPISGTYSLGTEVLDKCWLYIDGDLLLENVVPNYYQEAAIDLRAGRHDIRLRFLDQTDHSHIYLNWTRPDGVREIVPHERLFPLAPGEEANEPGNANRQPN